MSLVLFVLGAPGVGKTTLIRDLLGFQGLLPPKEGSIVKKPKWTVTAHVCAVGHYTGAAYDGGDTVPYAGAMEAVRYWHEHLRPQGLVTILDGRCVSRTVLRFLKETALHHPLTILGVHLVASPETLARRRAERGSDQSPAWMRGRETMARNFARMVGAEDLDAERSAATLGVRTREIVNEAREKLLDRILG